jgi:hypothetical protein
VVRLVLTAHPSSTVSRTTRALPWQQLKRCCRLIHKLEACLPNAGWLGRRQSDGWPASAFLLRCGLIRADVPGLPFLLSWALCRFGVQAIGSKSYRPRPFTGGRGRARCWWEEWVLSLALRHC